MASFFQTRKYVYLNTSLLFLLIIAWCVSCTHLVVRSFFSEPHLFYGTLSHASIPSLFGGSNIPFLDKTFFQINGDKDVTFILYSSQDLNDELAEWFSFASVDASSIPLEIYASRVKDNVFVVQSISTRDGGLDWEVLADYQMEYALIYAGITLLSFIAMVFFLVLGIITKLPPKIPPRHDEQPSVQDGARQAG